MEKFIYFYVALLLGAMVFALFYHQNEGRKKIAEQSLLEFMRIFLVEFHHAKTVATSSVEKSKEILAMKIAQELEKKLSTEFRVMIGRANPMPRNLEYPYGDAKTKVFCDDILGSLKKLSKKHHRDYENVDHIKYDFFFEMRIFILKML